jgi:hypothetical protein
LFFFNVHQNLEVTVLFRNTILVGIPGSDEEACKDLGERVKTFGDGVLVDIGDIRVLRSLGWPHMIMEASKDF